MLLLTPAAWWLKLIVLPPQLQLGTVSGSLWQGEISAVKYQQLYFPAVRWQLNGWRLFTGKMQFTLQSGSKQQFTQPFLDARVSYGFSGAALQNTVVRLPMMQLVPMLPLPLPVAATGDLVLEIADYQQGQPWCQQLQGNVSWLDARLQSPTGNWLELQSLFGALSCEQGTVQLNTDPANALGLDVKVVLNAEQMLVNGTIKPDASMPDEVHQAMQFVGKPDAQGRYRISF